MTRFSILAAIGTCIFTASFAQTAQHGVNLSQQSSDVLRYEYVGYRPARYETDNVNEPENERPNEGGFVTVYYTNISDEPQNLRFWRTNGEDESYWRLGDYMVWDRRYAGTLAPGETDVIELNAVTKDFAPGSSFEFGWVSNAWRPTGNLETTLQEDSLQISFIRFSNNRTNLEVHVRHRGSGNVTISDIEVVGRTVSATEWRGATIEGTGHAIARLNLAEPIPESSLTIVRVKATAATESRWIYAHRRAFDDWFPIGNWSNNPEWMETLARLHIDLVVNGEGPDGYFHTTAPSKYGIQAMAHTGKPIAPQHVQPNFGNQNMRVWMLMDEPDWNTKAAILEHMDRQLRRMTSHAPTFITLCRNVKFFEYAQIPDIICHDHYCVAAPSSSKWPKRYGTRLEETAYYTRDLKYAGEPKPIWVWTQGVGDWDGRPKRGAPTPEELAAQLTLNLGRGAKGIIWFNYNHEAGEKYPDAREAMQRWGRVMRVIRDDFIAAEPIDAAAMAPEGIDIALLAGWDTMFVVLTNTDYEIDPEAYPFTPHEDVSIRLPLPSWIQPAAAMAVTPDGIESLNYTAGNSHAQIEVGDIEVCRIIAITRDPQLQSRYQAAYKAALHNESRSYE